MPQSGILSMQTPQKRFTKTDVEVWNQDFQSGSLHPKNAVSPRDSICLLQPKQKVYLVIYWYLIRKIGAERA